MHDKVKTETSTLHKEKADSAKKLIPEARFNSKKTLESCNTNLFDSIPAKIIVTSVEVYSKISQDWN